MYAKNNCVFQYHCCPRRMQLHAQLEPRVPGLGEAHGLALRRTTRSMIALYSEVLQSFRLAAQGKTARRQPPEQLRERIETYFDPLPFWYPPLETQLTDGRVPAERDHAAADGDVPLLGLAERVAAADPQPQLPVREPAHRARRASPTAAGSGSSRSGAGCAAWRATARRWSPARCGPGTRSARRAGAWQLAPDADESQQGFLLNHLITEELPYPGGDGSATPIRSPARRAGTTCGCGSTRPSRERRRLAAGDRARRHRRGSRHARRRAWMSRGRTRGDRMPA